MSLPRTFLKQNIGRPKDLLDFDLRPGLAYLVPRSRSPRQSVWTTSWWLNLACFGAALTQVTISFVAWAHRDDLVSKFSAFPLWGKVLAVGFAALFVGLLVLFIRGFFCRGKLIIEKEARQLRFQRGVFIKCEFVLCFDRIRALTSTRIEVRSIDTEGCDYSNYYWVVIAELHNGDLVMIAKSPDWRKESLFREIHDAVEAARQMETNPLDEPRRLLLM